MTTSKYGIEIILNNDSETTMNLGIKLKEV